MDTFHFEFRKNFNSEDGPVRVDIEVITDADVSKDTARLIAECEIQALQLEHFRLSDRRLRTRIESLEQAVKQLPDYRLWGAN